MSVKTVKARLERLSSRTYNAPRKPTAPRVIQPRGIPEAQNELAVIYYWVLGYTDGGKRCVLGPCRDSIEAYELADGLNESEVFELKTRDQSKAVKQIRVTLLRRGGTADEAIARQLHEKGLVRELDR